MPVDPQFANAWLTPQGGSSGTGGGSNQYMSYPNINPTQGVFQPTANNAQYAFGQGIGGGRVVTPTIDPNFTQQFYGLLQGLTPDKLSAPQNPLLQLLQQYFSQGPSALPGTQALTTQAGGDPNLSAIVASGGDPISAMPAWQSMIDAQQQNIGRNQANLKEQFAFGGDLKSSPFGDAMQNFQSQTTLDQNSLLAQMMQQSMESAMGRKLTAAETLSGNELAAGQTLDSSALGFTGQAQQSGEFQQTQMQNAINMLMQMLQQGAYATPNVMQGQTASQTFGNIMAGLGDVFKGSVSKTSP